MIYIDSNNKLKLENFEAFIKNLENEKKFKIRLTLDEAFIKSESIKRLWRSLLIKDLKNKLKLNKEFKNIKIKSNRVFIELVLEDFDKNLIKDLFSNVLIKIFGVKKIYLILDFKSEEEIKDFLRKYIKNNISLFERGKKFKVYFKRSYKAYPKNSIDLNKEFGSFIYRIFKENGLDFEVSLKNPDFEFKFIVEKHDKFIYFNFIFFEIDGIGGIPLDTQKAHLNLFSGGIDSPVSAYLLGKRGSKPIFLFYNLADEDYLVKVYEVYKKINSYFLSDFYCLDIREFLTYFLNIKQGYRQLALKWFFYKIAESFAKSKGIYAIGTGESLGQVSTQTLDSLMILNNSLDLIVLRPLLAFDKVEIKRLAEKIGTLSLSEKLEELCPIEKKSNPNPDIKVFEKEIKKLNFDFKEIINKIKKIDENYIKKIKKNIDNVRKSKVCFYNIEEKDWLKNFLTNIDSKSYKKYEVLLKREIDSLINELEKNKKLKIICKSGFKAKIFKDLIKKELKERALEKLIHKLE